MNSGNVIVLSIFLWFFAVITKSDDLRTPGLWCAEAYYKNFLFSGK